MENKRPSRQLHPLARVYRTANLSRRHTNQCALPVFIPTAAIAQPQLRLVVAEDAVDAVSFIVSGTGGSDA